MINLSNALQFIRIAQYSCEAMICELEDANEMELILQNAINIFNSLLDSLDGTNEETLKLNHAISLSIAEIERSISKALDEIYRNGISCD